MIRVAALALALAATPAAAGCLPVAEALPKLQSVAGPDAVVRPLPGWIAPAIVEYAPILKGADGIVAAVTPTGILLFPTSHGKVCDGTAGRISVEDTAPFLAWLKAWMDERGITTERPA